MAYQPNEVNLHTTSRLILEVAFLFCGYLQVRHTYPKTSWIGVSEYQVAVRGVYAPGSLNYPNDLQSYFHIFIFANAAQGTRPI